MRDRMHYNPKTNILEIDFSHLAIERVQQIEEMKSSLVEIVGPLDQKVYALVNYEGFQVEDELKERYGQVIREMYRKYFKGTVRYSSSALARVTIKTTSPDNGIEGNTFPNRKKALEAIARMQGKKKIEEDM